MEKPLRTATKCTLRAKFNACKIGYIPVPRGGLGLAGQERFELSTFGFGDA
jgi:hypothetical protein